MPQYKNRMYRKEWLSERRKLARALEGLEQNLDLAGAGISIPTNDAGQPMGIEELRERIADLDGKLERYPNPQK
ncbi:MAG TPA: hypothetical protein VD886_19590 [Herpetosiphonaceae bacterium]|nr:hypothetical protein [Herpetosiphonaceae bacterium]